MIGIYRIVNNLNNKSYIGQSKNIEQRIKQHKDAIQTSNKSWYPEARIESNSINDFTFSVLQTCSIDELDELEEYWIKYYDSFNNGYNKSSNGQCKNTGIKLIIKYDKYNNDFQSLLLSILYKLTKINTITQADKILIILFLTQINNTEPFFFTESWVRQYTGLSHDTYMTSRKKLSNLKIFICEDRKSLTLSIDNLLNLESE